MWGLRGGGSREDSGSVGPLNDARNFETDEMIVHVIPRRFFDLHRGDDNFLQFWWSVSVCSSVARALRAARQGSPFFVPQIPNTLTV